MAEEMQGIMGLQEGQDMGQMGQIDPSKFSPEIEGYARANPRQFSRDILGGIAEADPALAQQFVTALSSMQLPPEVIDALQLMVDNILADPSTYVQDRQELIAEGVPEEILPEQFDPAFFAALNIALDQIDSNRPAPVPAYARGGIIDVKKISKEIAAMGRGGDTMLAHITPEEARMLRKQGGSGTVNPKTGLQEFGFFKGISKAIGGVFKSVSKAIKGVVKGIGSIVKSITKSAIGKMALTFAAVYFMGPAGFNVAGSLGIQGAAMANAVNTFAGSALVNMASGQKIGDALKGAAVSGALAGATTAAFGGSTLGSKQPTTPAPVVDKSINLGGTSLGETATAGVVTPSTAGPSSITAYNPSANVETFALPNPEPVIGYPIGQSPSITSGGISNIASSAVPVTPQIAPGGIESLQAAGTGIGMGPNPSLVSSYGTPAAAPANLTGGVNALSSAPPVTAPPTGFMDTLKQGASDVWNKISPSGIEQSAIPAAQKAGTDAISELVARIPTATPAMQQAAYDAAYKSAMPGMLTKYGPLAAVGLGGAYLGGAFKVPKQPVPDNIDQFKTTGMDLLNKEPEKYGLSFGGVNTTYAPNPYERMYEAYATPKLYKSGGEAYPRKVGHIAGPGTGTSDSVPAMLSDGEFVFTAKAVRAMGQGSRRKGAKRMYALMKQLEKKG